MAIELRDVRFAYAEAPDKPVLDIPHWSVPRGEQVFLHGPSGTGKSTLLNVISGLLPATQGEVLVMGQALNALSTRQRDRFRANHIGYVFQQFNLIPYLDAVDNVQLASHFSNQRQSAPSREEITGLLSTLKLTAADWEMPTGRLSIGQQQRVAIARALINQPELLIADEPTSSLDQVNRDNFMAVLLSMAEQSGITLLFVSHDMSLSGFFKRVDAMTELGAREAAH